MPSYRDSQKSSIVKIARNILASEGLEGLRARSVASAAGCSVGTIYNLFGSLDMIVIAANADTLTELHELLVQAKGTRQDLEGQLDALAMAYLDFAQTRTLEWRAIFEHRFATKTVVPEWYREAQAELFAVIEGLLQPVIADQETRIEAARALFSAVHGVVSIALDEKLGVFDPLATGRQVQFIVKSIAQGMSQGRQA